MKQMARRVLLLPILSCLVVSMHAFSIPGYGGSSLLLRSTRMVRSQAANVCMKEVDSGDNEAMPCITTLPAGSLARSRRSVLIGVLGIMSAVWGDLGRYTVGATEESEEVVVQGEMRLEKGSDAKFQKLGGKGTIVVTLRCVGKGIISQTSFDVDVKDFPPAGKPTTKNPIGGGVPFVVKVKDLKEKTEKGKEMWGDDDIFVRVDLKVPSGKTILSGLGKAKYAEGTHQSSFVLLE